MKTQVRKVRQAVGRRGFSRGETELRLAAKKLDRAGVKARHSSQRGVTNQVALLI